MTAIDDPPFDPRFDEPDEYRTTAPTSGAARAPAHDTNAERSVIGAMILAGGPDTSDTVMATGLTAADFYAPRHATIYQAIVDTLTAGEIPDVVTVSGRLPGNPIDWGRDLIAMQAEVPSVRNAWSYATRVLNCAHARRLQGHALEIAEAAQTGNIDEALRRIATLTDNLPADDTNTWSPIDLGPTLAGNLDAPEPTILHVDGGPALFYRGRTNSIFGPPGGAKTWVCQAAVVEAIQAGDTAMFIDFEDDERGIVARLTLLGLTPDQIRDQLIYYRPDQAWSATAQAAVGKVVTERAPTVAVIDSTGEAMAIDGVKGNDDDDVARWFTSFPSYLARLGPAVILIDHVVKDPNAPKDYAIGSQRKRAAIHGAAYRVDTIKEPSKTTDGLLSITTAKDRHGHHTKGQTAAMVAMTHPHGDGVHIALTAATEATRAPDGSFRPTVLMERMSRTLEAESGLSQEVAVTRTTGNAKQLRRALGILIEEGFVENDPTPGRFAYSSIKPFRVDPEPPFDPAYDDPGEIGGPVDNEQNDGASDAY